MKNSHFRHLWILLVLLLVSLPKAAFCFTAEDIISPANGVWYNKQALVLNVWDGSDLYYSFTGSDPLVSGFAYDGPAVIDAEGDISIRITAVSKDGIRSDFVIDYTVRNLYKDNPSIALTPQEQEFIFLLQNNSLINLQPSYELKIPEGFVYSTKNWDDKAYNFYDSRSLVLNKNNCLERYIPLTIQKGIYKFHTVIRNGTKRTQNLQLTNDLPFEITNFDTFRFTAPKLIYKIDDSYWSADNSEILLDRSVPHVISWQSMAYEFGNPIYSFELPPMPDIITQYREDGSISFVFKDKDGTQPQNYLFVLHNQNQKSGSINYDAVSEVTVDSFFGDSFTSRILCDVYYGSLNQGNVVLDVVLNKTPPLPPVITSSSDGSGSSLARDKVFVNIQGQENSLVYYALSEPLVSQKGFSTSDRASMEQTQVGNDFIPYDGQTIELSSVNGMATFYKLCAFVVNELGTASAVSEYSVVVDEYNYYLSASDSVSAEEDGSFVHPFTSLKNALNFLSGVKGNCVLHVSGIIPLENINYNIGANITFAGNSDSSQCVFAFSSNSSISINNCEVVFSDIIFEQSGSNYSGKFVNMFTVQDSSLSFKGCEIVSSGVKNGTLVSAKDCNLYFENTGLTIQASAYGSCVSGEHCVIDALDSRFTVSSDTGSCLTSHDGSVRLYQNQLLFQGTVGHCIEATNGCEAYLNHNGFTLRNSLHTDYLNVVYIDTSSFVRESSDNEISGK